MIDFFKHPMKSFRNCFNDTAKEIPERELLPEIITNILKNMDFSYFECCFLINKKWNQLTKSAVKQYIFYNIAFNGHFWNLYLGENTVSQEEIKKSLDIMPEKMWSILNRASPEFPFMKIYEAHLLIYIPEAIDEKKMTLNNFEVLITKANPDLTKKWDKSQFLKFLYNREIRSGYVLMMKDSISASNRHTLQFQENHLRFLNGINYEIPFFEEAAVCIYAEYLRSGIPLFAMTKKFSPDFGWYDANTFISCKNGMVVGNFDKEGLTIKQGKALYPNRQIGAAPIARLNPSAHI